MQCYNKHRNCSFLLREAAMLARSWDRNSVLPSVCLFVSLSVTRVLCNVTKESTAEIFTPHVHFHVKFALKLTHPL